MTINRRSSKRISTTTSLKTSAGSSNDKLERATNKKQKLSTTKKKSHWSRPGVEAAARLVSLPISSSSSVDNNIKSWNTALSNYESMIKAKDNTKLYNLDQQRQLIAQQWREDYIQNEECNMTKDQLLNVIIPWKFGKGKPRNALKPLLQSNKEEDVVNASMLAFNFAESSIANNTNNEDGSDVNHVQEAIKTLCQLSGVGPATASAVLSAYCPQSFAFMDDEVIECLYEAKRGYTLKIYLAVNDRCVDIAEGLNGASGGGSSGGWTPADVAKALWTVATMSARNDEVGLCKVFGD